MKATLTELTNNINQLLQHQQYKLMNNAILKYICCKLPKDLLNKIEVSDITAISDDDIEKYGEYKSIRYHLKQDVLNADADKTLTDPTDNINKNENYWSIADAIDENIKTLSNIDVTDAADISEIIHINNKPVMAEYTNNNNYMYHEHIIKKVIEDYTNELAIYDENGSKNISDADANIIHDKIKKQLYLLNPNPTSKLCFLVYERDDINYFVEMNASKRINKILETDYNKFNPIFRRHYSFNKFIKYLPHYMEENKTSNNILFADGYMFNSNELTIVSEIEEIPAVKSDLKYKTITKEQINILDTYFRKMYPEDAEFKKMLLYILCNFNKYHLKQSIFINIDDSGVGKTARILPMLELGFNANADSNILKKTELYNIANYNMLIVNEADKDKINGSILSDLADSSPHMYTTKGNNAITVKAEDRPCLTIIGENLPLIEQLNNGTARRLLLIPQVAESYKFLVSDIHKIENGTITDAAKIKKCNIPEFKQFYNLLYNNPFEVIEYYLLKIHEYNIIDDAENIANQMKVTIKDITKLSHTTDEIFNKFFIAEPTAQHETPNINGRIIIGSGQSLNNLLDLINNNYMKTDHFNTTKHAKKYLSNWLKETNEIKNLKDYGRSTLSNQKYQHTEPILYVYQITEYGKKIIDDHNNKTEKLEDKIFYKHETNADEY